MAKRVIVDEPAEMPVFVCIEKCYLLGRIWQADEETEEPGVADSPYFERKG